MTMTPEDPPPDVDDLARSMLELLGVHEHDEPPRAQRRCVRIMVKAPGFAADPQRLAAVQEATRQDRERYLSAGLVEIDCRFCHIAVKVKKLGAAHTRGAVEPRSAQQRCAYFAEIREAGGSSARTRSARSLSDSIRHAVAEGCLEEYSSAPAPVTAEFFLRERGRYSPLKRSLTCSSVRP